MRSILGDANREVPLGRHLEEFRADMKNLEKKVERLEAKITTFKAKGAE
jgi:ubiquinone biosynthesis protein UbiJ